MQELVDGLERVRMKHTEAVIFQGHVGYVQAIIASEDHFKLEAVSDEFLEKPLTTAQLLALRRLGFQPPGPLSPNHWKHVPADPAVAAELLGQALTEVYGEYLDEVDVVDV